MSTIRVSAYNELPRSYWQPRGKVRRMPPAKAYVMAKKQDVAATSMHPTWPMWQGWIDSGHVTDRPDAKHPVSVQGFVHDDVSRSTTHITNAPAYVTVEYIERLSARIFPPPTKAKDRALMIDRLKGGEIVQSLFNEYRWVA